MAGRGTLFVVSAPSGAGKHTIIRKVLERDPNFVPVITATTRKPRDGEIQGKDYWFYDRDEFLRRVQGGEFLEWAEVHGNYYGTLRSELDRALDSGKDALLQVDVQGMRNLQWIGQEMVTIFIMPPSVDELRDRLEKRATEDAEVIAMRLENAREEISARHAFDHIIVNDLLENAVAAFEEIVRTAREKKKEE